MRKGAEAFRSIGEVATLIGVAPHVLRYWETQFTLLKPMKRPDGRRYYRPDDVRLAAGLCEVLRDEGLTIRGARKLMSRDRGESVRAIGAARLGEAMGSRAGADHGGATPADGAAPRRDPDIPAEADFDEEADDMTRGPRSRQRRRHPAPDHGHLPLFPDMAAPRDAAPADAVLAALRAMDRLPPQLVAPAQRLCASLRALNGATAPR